jgi:hypothetical protein
MTRETENALVTLAQAKSFELFGAERSRWHVPRFRSDQEKNFAVAPIA